MDFDGFLSTSRLSTARRSVNLKTKHGFLEKSFIDKQPRDTTVTLTVELRCLVNRRCVEVSLKIHQVLPAGIRTIEQPMKVRKTEGRICMEECGPGKY
jgi:hypothetical protein